MEMEHPMGRRHLAILAGIAMSALSQATWADVKAGVDAWSRGDHSAAVREWQQPAEKGDADALFNLGQAYKLGRGVAQDLTRAEDLFSRAAAAGHLQAGDNYGLLLFQRGERARALPYITAAADRGDPRAMYLLGIAHFNGDIVGKDWVRAYALESLAQQAGLSQAGSALAQMDEHIPLDQRQQAAALASELSDQIQATRARQLAASDLGASVDSDLPAPPVSPPAPRTASDSPRTAGADYARPQATDPSPAAAARPATAPAPAAPTPAASTGQWHIQLGAFGLRANAEALWNRVGSRPEIAGRSKHLVPAGSVTKLQVWGYASETEAKAACARLSAAGFACMTMRNRDQAPS